MRHQIESYNYFIEHQIQETINMYNPVHIVSENDNREYIVKEVAGKGGNLNKRWILNK